MAIFNSYVSLPEGNFYADAFEDPEFALVSIAWKATFPPRMRQRRSAAGPAWAPEMAEKRDVFG
jgi:hypothetical protein